MLLQHKSFLYGIPSQNNFISSLKLLVWYTKKRCKCAGSLFDLTLISVVLAIHAGL